MRLDDFYKDLDAPDLPRSEELGMVDWDHPDSWDEPPAVAAMSTLLATGTAVMPIYDISVSRATGEHTVTARPDDLVVAEGIFAAEAIPALREAGLLHSAWCIRHHRLKTFVLRLARDLKERRKPPLVLVRRGLALMRDQQRVVAHAVRRGCRRATGDQAYAELSADSDRATRR